MCLPTYLHSMLCRHHCTAAGASCRHSGATASPSEPVLSIDSPHQQWGAQQRMNLSVQGPAASSSAVPARVPPAASGRRPPGGPRRLPLTCEWPSALHQTHRMSALDMRRRGVARRAKRGPGGGAEPGAQHSSGDGCTPPGFGVLLPHGWLIPPWVLVAPLPSPPGVPSRRFPNTPRCCCPPRPPRPASTSLAGAGAGNWRRGEPWS